MKVVRFVRYWMPAIVWMAVIFLGSTDMLSAEHTSRFLVPFLRWIDPQISLVALNAIQLGIRKLGHLTEYAILAMLLWRALRGGIRCLQTFRKLNKESRKLGNCRGSSLLPVGCQRRSRHPIGNRKSEIENGKVGLTGLEPVTLRLSSACSNQLSYRPAKFSE